MSVVDNGETPSGKLAGPHGTYQGVGPLTARVGICNPCSLLTLKPQLMNQLFEPGSDTGAQQTQVLWCSCMPSWSWLVQCTASLAI